MRQARWLVLLFAMCVPFVAAQAQTPTPQQLEMLKSLSPADREALMQQYGISGEAAASVEASAARSAEGAIPKTRAEREQDIERAEKAQLEAQRALVQYNEQLSSAQGEAAKLREDARAQGAAILEELRTKAQDEAARITAAAHASIEAERQQAITSLRNEVGALAVELASKIVGEALDDQARQSRIVDRFIEDLEKSQQSK